MAEFGENFRAGMEKVMCPLCTLHLDDQNFGPACPVLRRDLNMTGNYSDMYNNNVSVETVAYMEKVMECRTLKKQKKMSPFMAHVSLCLL